MEAETYFFQRRPRLAEDGDGVEIIELFQIVIEVSVFPLVGRYQKIQILVVPQGLLGGAAQGGETAGGEPVRVALHKSFPPI